MVIADSGVAAGNCGAQVHFDPVGAHDHPQQMPLDELSVGLGDWFRVRAVSLQVAAEDIDDQRLQLRTWHPSNRSRWRRLAKRCLRDVVKIAHPVLVGVGRGHAVALHVKQAPGQERRRAPDAAAPLGRLRGELRLHISEQGGIQDRLVIAPERLAAIDHLTDVEPVAEQMGEAADPEGAPANDAAIGELSLFGADAAAVEVLRQRLHRAKLQIAGEDRAHGFGGGRLDDDLFGDGRITERDRSADPHPLALEAAILSRTRSPMTSRSNWAKDSRILRVSRPILDVVLKD
jgi:hypothetical protein